MDVELRHLRYFVAVAEEASFTAATRRVHVTQQVLSAQIRQLEDALGVELLERTSRGVTLTPAGEAFLEGARDTLRALERTTAATRNVAGALAGRLTVGLSVAAGGDEPTRMLAAFAQACPHVEVRVLTYDLTQPAAGLLDYSTDVAFVRPPVVAEGVTTQVVGREPRLFVLAQDDPLARSDHLQLNDVAGRRWIAADVATDGCDPSAWRDAWLMAARPNRERLPIGAVARTIDEWREYAVAGRGISLCPASAETHYARPGLAFVPSEGVPPVDLCVAWRNDDTNPVVERFVRVVTEEAQGIP